MKSIVTKEMMSEINDRICDGESLTQICKDSHLPCRRTIARHIQRNEEAYEEHSKARAIQGHYYEDLVADIAKSPLPADPKMAMAEATWRRIKMDNLEKLKRKLQPLGGIRNKKEDVPQGVPSKITFEWDG